MIIKIKGSNIFTGSGLGNISSLGKPYSVTVNCSTSGATITIKASGMTTVTSTSGTATMSNIPYGTRAYYTVSAEGYTTKTGSTVSGGTIPITLTAVNTGGNTGGGNTGGDNTGVTTWYIKSLKQLEESGNTFENKVHLEPSSSYAWVFNTFNPKLSGQTINTIRIMIGKESSSSDNKFYIGVYDPKTYQVTDTRIIDTSGAELNSIQTYTFNDLTIPNDKYFTWNCSYTGSSERSGYYILKANLDPLAVETSTWYQAYKDKMTAFGTYELVFLADIGYTDSGNGGSTPSEPSTPELPENSEWYIKSLSELESSNNDYKTTGVNLTPNHQYSWAFQEELNDDIAGKTINAIRIYIDKQGSSKKFSVGVYDPDTHTVTDIREITIDDAHVGTTQLYRFNNLTIPSGKFFVWNCSLKSGEASGRYVLEDKLDKSKVKTSGWYFAKPTEMEKFSNYRLVFVADVGYINN